jgi:hypothetical protein
MPLLQLSLLIKDILLPLPLSQGIKTAKSLHLFSDAKIDSEEIAKTADISRFRETKQWWIKYRHE